MTLYRDINIGIAGSGGDGVVSAGDLLTAAAANEGLFCMLIKSFGAQIRGGESSIRLRISDEVVLMQGDEIDVLVALDIREMLKFSDEMIPKEGCVFIYDTGDKGLDQENMPFAEHHPHYYGIPMKELANKEVGTSLAKNIVMLGAVAELFKLPSKGLQSAIEHKFKRKKQAVTDSNLKALIVGAQWVRDNLTKADPIEFTYEKGHSPRLVMDGNQAFAYGALYAGCRFYAGYPITPSSEVLHWMHQYLPQYDGTLVQAEDEMAAIGMVLGASLGGARPMTATSGPGVALMSEMLGLAWAAELGCVVINCQRCGPSTGIPTKPEQSDLNQALYSSSGDAPRVVLAPADTEDCFQVAVDAFNIADCYQVPVVVLSDQFIGQRSECVRRFDPTAFQIKEPVRPTAEELEHYQRFRVTDNGVSPAALPGTPGGQFITAGIEHTESGAPTASYTVHEQQNAKRFAKLDAIGREYHFVRHYGPDRANIGLLGWGSSKGVMKKLVEIGTQDGLSISACVPQILNPLPAEQIQDFIDSVDQLIVLELSYSAQFYRYLRSLLQLPTNTVSYARSGGKPFGFRELYTLVTQYAPSATVQEATVHG